MYVFAYALIYALKILYTNSVFNFEGTVYRYTSIFGRFGILTLTIYWAVGGWVYSIILTQTMWRGIED